LIGELIRLIRVFHDLSLSELAKSLSISPSYLSEIENGKKQPTLDFIKNFSAHFNIRPSTILFFIEEFDNKTSSKSMKNIVRNNFLKFLKYVESEPHGRDVEIHPLIQIK
jgi:transcriptional regulator with XRE-family HTH domain